MSCSVKRPRPKGLLDLTAHSCQPTVASILRAGVGRLEVRVQLEEQLVFNSATPMLEAVLADCRPIYVLADRCPPSLGYHLCTASGAGEGTDRRDPSIS
jgi:hypothetical protein